MSTASFKFTVMYI